MSSGLRLSVPNMVDTHSAIHPAMLSERLVSHTDAGCAKHTSANAFAGMERALYSRAYIGDRAGQQLGCITVNWF